MVANDSSAKTNQMRQRTCEGIILDSLGGLAAFPTHLLSRCDRSIATRASSPYTESAHYRANAMQHTGQGSEGPPRRTKYVKKDQDSKL